MHFLALLAVSASLIISILADDNDLALPTGDIPNVCNLTVLCASVVQLAKGWQAITAAAAPSDDDK